MKTVIVRITILISIIVVLIECKISIDIDVGNRNDVTVTHSGFEANVISDQEIEQFNIGRNNLRKAIRSFYGRTPSNVYLKSPTPWGDLYEKFKWEQVIRVLTVKSVRVKDITKNPVIVMSHDFENLSNVTIKVNTGISQTVENTLTTSWTRSKELTVSQEIEYGLNVLFTKASGTTGLSFTSSWGESEEKTESITIGSNTGVETELKPGQAATAVLSANKGTLDIEVLYEANLRGNVAVNFKTSYNGHHFWGPSIDSVMKKAGLENALIVKETISMGFYVDALLKVYDRVSGVPL